jgi:hypothetical protein
MMHSGALRASPTGRAIGWRAAAWFCAALALVIVFHLGLCARFLSRDGHAIGHDYGYFLPQLLNGSYWFGRNGIASIPWFTPALGGGVPFYANPACIYVSVPQALALVVDPVVAVQASTVSFAAIGFAGMFALLSRTFGLAPEASALGAFTFALNGFFSARMTIGHLGFHSCMLVPAIAHAVLRPSSAAGVGAGWQLAHSALACALGFAYMFQSGNFYGVLPALLSIAALALVLSLRGALERAWLVRLSIGVLGAVGLCAAKLAAGMAFTGSFPRSDYTVPGAATLAGAARVAIRGLFFSAPTEIAQAEIGEQEWFVGREELQYGLTWIPLALLAAWAAMAIVRVARRRTLPAVRRGLVVRTLLLVVVLAFPLALNVHEERWNALLKHVPVLGSTSTHLRVFFAYVPVAAVGAACALESVVSSSRARALLAGAAILGVLVLQARVDHTDREAPNYDPQPVRAAWSAWRSSGAPPVVERIVADVDARGRVSPTIQRNNALIEGASQFIPYEPIFGYRLEHFPFKELHRGSVLEVAHGVLNVKNPSLFLFPRANGGEPGDHYRPDQRAEAEKLLSYRPIQFTKPPLQHAAEAINVLCLIGAVALGVLGAARSLRAVARDRALAHPSA